MSKKRADASDVSSETTSKRLKTNRTTRSTAASSSSSSSSSAAAVGDSSKDGETQDITQFSKRKMKMNLRKELDAKTKEKTEKEAKVWEEMLQWFSQNPDH